MSVFRTEAEIQPAVSVNFSEESCRLCDFCGKLVPSKGSEILERLSGEQKLFCSFCLRNRCNKRQRHLLTISFRSVFAYLYYELYLPQQPVLLSQIEDFIDRLCEVGNANPLFFYDPDTMLWHVDFARVGDHSFQMSKGEVKQTVSSIVSNLCLTVLFPDIQCEKFELKYCSAIDKFDVSDRVKRFVLPTLRACGVPDPKGQNWEKHRDFVRSNMTIRSK